MSSLHTSNPLRRVTTALLGLASLSMDRCAPALRLVLKKAEHHSANPWIRSAAAPPGLEYRRLPMKIDLATLISGISLHETVWEFNWVVLCL